MIGLATRGYLRRLQPPDIVFVGDGPDIIDAKVLKPSISGAGTGPQVGAPSIASAKSLVPAIQGAQPGPVAVPPGAPTIIGGTLLVPIIQSGEED
jgi:hypothetical protein